MSTLTPRIINDQEGYPESSTFIINPTAESLATLFPVNSESGNNGINASSVVDDFIREDCVCSDLTAANYSMEYTVYNFGIVILLMPIVSLFGLYSNVANVWVYTRPLMLNSANVYLAGLATSDFFVVLTGLFIFWVDSARSYFSWLKYAPYSILGTMPIGYIAQTCSVYFTVFAAIDCFVSVCCTGRPGLVRFWCSVNRAKQVVFAVLIASIVYNSPRFGQLKLHHCFPDGKTGLIEICPTTLLFAMNQWYNVYLYMIIMTFIPFIILTILNAVITLVSSVNNKKRIQYHQEAERMNGGGMESNGADSNGSDATTMIMVVFMFLFCNILALVVNIVEAFAEISSLTLNYMTDTSNFLVILNSSVNFVIYVVFSEDFRELFIRSPFNCYCLQSRSDNMWEGATGTGSGKDERVTAGVKEWSGGGGYVLVPQNQTTPNHEPYQQHHVNGHPKSTTFTNPSEKCLLVVSEIDGKVETKMENPSLI